MYTRCLVFFLLLSVAILSGAGCTRQVQPDNSYFTRIIDLEHSLAFPTIVEELNNYQWGKQNDPQMLMIYCEALVETNQGLTEFLKKKSIPEYQKVFAKGYAELLSGNYRSGVAKFVDLIGTEEGRIWGYIGSLEYAIHTENITSIKGPLLGLKDAAEHNPSSVPSWVIPYYSAWYAYYTFDFKQMAKILEEQRSKKEIDAVTELALKMRLFINNNNLVAAEETFKNLSQPLAHYQSIIALWSDIIDIRHGPEEAARFLDQKRKQYPLAWEIEKKYAQALIEAGQVQEGLALIEKLAKQRPFDFMLQLNLSLYLLSREGGKGVKEIFAKLHDPVAIPFYNILWARIYMQLGSEKEARDRINLARLVYPKYQQATWLTFWLEKKNNNYKEAKQALLDILDLDPNDVQALGYLTEINYVTGNYEDVISSANKIIESGRFISMELSDRINSYQALVWVSKGERVKANGYLNKIVNSEVRSKTADAIKEGKHKGAP